MKTFFSIAYTTIRPSLNERLSVGLFLCRGNDFLFKYSTSKLEILSKLLPKEAHQLLRANLKALDQFVEMRSKNEILTNTSERLLSESYFNYLSKYSNNLINFTAPQPIDVEFGADAFAKLFYKFVDDSIKNSIFPTDDIVVRVKQKIESVIEPHVNIDFELNNNHIKTLDIPTKVWFIGQNEVDVTGETIDFEKKYIFLVNDLRRYMYLIDRLKHADHNKGRHFLIAKEPNKKIQENHELWKQFRNNNEITYTEESEIERISQYIKEHDVTPFISE